MLLARNPRESAWLFVGPSGTGKTTMALALAQMVPAELHHIPSQECNLENIERVRKTCQYVPAIGFKMHLVLVDEADRMTDGAQVSLLSKLDATNFPPNTIFVFTCNDTSRLEPRFLSRLHTVEFSSYGIGGDASALLERVCLYGRLKLLQGQRRPTSLASLKKLTIMSANRLCVSKQNLCACELKILKREK